MGVAMFSILFALLGAEASEYKEVQPDHLEPIPAYRYWERDYGNVVFHTLIRQTPEMWMIVKPSFSTEHAITISKVTYDHYQVSFTEVARSIWDTGSACMYVRNPKYVKNPKKAAINNIPMSIDQLPKIPICGKFVFDEKKPVTSITKDIPLIAVQEIQKAWQSVLERTRYAKEPRLGFDGVGYEFFLHPDFFGKAWSPIGGVPLQMVELGQLLIKYTKADYVERVDLLRACVLKAMEIQRHQYKD